MASAQCADCDHEWETDAPAEELREPPRCPDCGSDRVDVRSSEGWFMVWR